ncbi:MAG: aspartate carbamoyltransferase catalytic subunit [Bacteriovoracaceae bacterium]|nr:aspartate carbamoyltransferase catalytic subunit [Bacteriovoracaceae bacterium]
MKTEKLHFHLNSIYDLQNIDTIRGLLLKAIFFAKNPVIVPLGKRICTMFLEDSTRTKLSFQIACQKLGVDTIDLDPSKSSLNKKESIEDTLQTLEAMEVDGVIIRTKDENLFENHIQKRSSFLINAGSGKTLHPTQALLDLLTIYKQFNKLTGLKITIIGDVAHSRVASSHANLNSFLENDLNFCAPKSMRTKHKNYIEFDDALKSSDVLIFLRVQNERHEKRIDLSNYNETFGLNEQNIKLVKDDAIIMHPGPINRGVEISENVLTDKRVKILDQVNNGIYIRMAIIDYLIRKNR